MIMWILHNHTCISKYIQYIRSLKWGFIVGKPHLNPTNIDALLIKNSGSHQDN